MEKKRKTAESLMDIYSGLYEPVEGKTEETVDRVMRTEKALRDMTDDYEICDTVGEFDKEGLPGVAFYLEDVFKAVYARDVIFKTPYAYLRWFWPVSYFLPHESSVFLDYVDDFITEHYKDIYAMCHNSEWLDAFYKLMGSYGFREELMIEPLDNLVVRYFSCLIFCMGERDICRFLDYDASNILEDDDYKRLIEEGRLALCHYAIFTNGYYPSEAWEELSDEDIKAAYASENLDRMDVFNDIACDVLNPGLDTNQIMSLENLIPLMNRISSKWIWERDQKNRPYYFDKPKFRTFAKHAFEKDTVQSARVIDLMNQIDNLFEDTRVVFEEVENRNEEEQRERIRDLERENASLKKKREELQDIINDQSQEIEHLKALLRKKEEKDPEFADDLSDALTDETDASAGAVGDREGESGQNLKPLSIEQIADVFNGMNITIVGGHDAWIRGIQAYLPDAQYIPAEVYTAEIDVKKTDLIIFKTNYLSHAQYNKYQGIAKTAKIPFVFSNKENNAEVSLRNIFAQWKEWHGDQ